MTSLGFESKNQTIFQMIADLDEDKSGELDFPEFFHLMIAKTDSANSKEKIHKLFNLFDDDRTGYISLQNLQRVASDLAENADIEELTEMIQRADNDGDMAVTEEEFYHIVTTQRFFKPGRA